MIRFTGVSRIDRRNRIGRNAHGYSVQHKPFSFPHIRYPAHKTIKNFARRIVDEFPETYTKYILWASRAKRRCKQMLKLA